MKGIGCFEQAKQIFRIRRRNVADDVDGKKRVAVGVEAAYRRHGFEVLHWQILAVAIISSSGTPETLYLFPAKAL